MGIIASIAILSALTAPIPEGKPFCFIEVTGKFRVVEVDKQKEWTIKFPIPKEYRGQVPLSFQLTVKPEKSLIKAKHVQDSLGNSIIELSLTPMHSGKTIDVTWKSMVLTNNPLSFQDCPKSAPFPESYPVEVQPWLRASTYVQSDSPSIQKKAAPFRGQDVIETMQKTVDGCRSILAHQVGTSGCLSSVEALTHQGSCVSNANLMAALFRANKIPARLLAGYPTMYNRPLQTHYIVEIYVDKYGWWPLEPSLCSTWVTAESMPIVSIVSVASENQGVLRYSGAEGVPYLSLTEAAKGLWCQPKINQSCDHEAKVKSYNTMPESVWKDAQDKWADWLKRTSDNYVDLEQTLPIPEKK